MKGSLLALVTAEERREDCTLTGSHAGSFLGSHILQLTVFLSHQVRASPPVPRGPMWMLIIPISELLVC